MLDSYFNSHSSSIPSIRWGVAVCEMGDEYIIKAQMHAETTEISEDEIPDRLRRLVIWTFTDGGRTAYIKLEKPLDFASFTAQLMVGHLFGQGLELERKGSDR